MSLIETFLLNYFGAFILVLARVGALVATAPIFGTKAAPMQFRAFLAIALTMLVTPMFSTTSPVDVTNLFLFGKAVVNEMLVGLLLGLGVMILLTGVQVSGQIVSQMGGTAVAEAFDPTLDTNVSVYSQLFYFLTLTMFVLLDGHRLLIGALLDTYVWLPPGEAALGPSYVEALTSILGQSFLLGIRAAAPAMIALFLSTLVLGLIGRTMPQINILVIGFGVNAMLTLGCLFVSLGAIAWAFPQQAGQAIDILRDAIKQTLPKA
ncbi:flagellar biosynthetic protein FliR [Adhaeretor mobilis]|uniref:Flagellar biosynthetic protein FliR n=1 Tax=Adhaeretor mobilis TaxID=1930276 RepID=A0A517MYU1_9BACT|nr:flagellar biosynthetic protein FliR [Adhaeretor mobilis]QDT00037.1 flagellar biosynthesis protein FliR [Adhaeretor mobilis]